VNTTINGQISGPHRAGYLTSHGQIAYSL